jgi:diaminopropionate ammonia-lyase
MISVIKNKMFDPIELKENAGLLSWDPGEIEEFHTSLGNQQTPLLRLSGLAQDLGISQLLIKDESPRFGLNAFKGLGASYAMYKQIEKNPKIQTFCTATDGNHGRAVSWMANKLGKKAIIYMPQGTVSSRVKSIEQEGAEVIVIENNYDAAVKMASGHVDEENQNSEEIILSLIQDTAWDGYEEVPFDIM